MSLIRILSTDDARKIFGKKEIQIIKKQLFGIKLTQSEKNRLSRDIRPKLRVIKKLSNIEINLKKNSSNLRLVNKVVDLILQDELQKDILAILLFGSHVTGNATFRSDIDICVVFKKITLKEATKFRIRNNLFKKVDVQIFNILPQKIKRMIAKNHKILYSKDFDNISFTIKYLKDEDFFIRSRLLNETDK